MYSEKVVEHFMNPRNAGKLKDASAIGEAGNPVCGDLMRIYIKVVKRNGKHIIEDIKFETLGCAAAIATSSITTELAKGKTIEEALAITNRHIVNELQGLPATKLHCSVLASDALREAIYNYMKKEGLKIPEWLEKEHERIARERNIVEHRHEDFTELQKKVFNSKS